jgi:hypothetical protein
VPTNFADSTKTGLLEILATSRVASPSVRVTDARGDAPSSCQVALFSTNPSHWTVPPRWTPGPARDGVVKLGPILPGEYFVAALTPDDFSVLVNDVVRLADLASVAARVTFVEGDTRTLELQMTPLPAKGR